MFKNDAIALIDVKKVNFGHFLFLSTIVDLPRRQITNRCNDQHFARDVYCSSELRLLLAVSQTGVDTKPGTDLGLGEPAARMFGDLLEPVGQGILV